MSTISETDIDQLAASQLSAINQRYTKNRRQLVEILLGTSKPITINQILESDSKLAQSSVYRNLAVLEQAGLVAKIITNDEHAHYELAEHILDHHHHISNRFPLQILLYPLYLNDITSTNFDISHEYK